MKTDLEQRLAELEVKHQSLIAYPRFVSLVSDMLECLELTQLSGEPHCMSLEGDTGVGKTKLVRTFGSVLRSQHPNRMGQDPFLYAVVHKPARMKAVASSILKALKDPLAGKGTEWSMNFRIIDLTQERGVRAVVLDDAQHFVDQVRGLPLYEVADWLKYIVKETGVTFYLIGITGKVNPVIETNPQLSRLFAVRECLEPFVWNAKDAETIVTLGKFVQIAEAKFGLPLTGQLPRQELLYRIHYATGGFVGNMINLFRLSGRYAQKIGQEELSLAALSWGFRKRLAKHLSLPNDPFEAKWGERFSPAPARLKTSLGDALAQ